MQALFRLSEARIKDVEEKKWFLYLENSFCISFLLLKSRIQFKGVDNLVVW